MVACASIDLIQLVPLICDKSFRIELAFVYVILNYGVSISVWPFDVDEQTEYN